MTLTDAQQARIAELDKQAKAEIAAMAMDNRTRQDAALKALTDSLAITDSGTPDPTPGGNVLRVDNCTASNPSDVWGDTTGDLADPSRHQLVSSGGPTGGPFRRLTVQSNDSMSYSGRRAEIGNNNRSAGLASASNRSGTFWLGKEGQHNIIRYHLRLPSSFPSSGSSFNNVSQLKHACPCSGANSDQPELTLQVRQDKWCLYYNAGGGAVREWSTAVSKGVWVPIKWDVVFSKSSSTGKVQLTIGSASSPMLTRRTMGYTSSGAMDSHLRVGNYAASGTPGTTIDIGPVTVEAG